MTPPSAGIVRGAFLALAAASLTAPACTLLVGSCECPTPTGFAMVALPAAQSSPIANVSASSPCTAWDGGGGHVNVSTPSATTCQAVVQLTNGATYTLSVEFRFVTSNGGGCNCTLLQATGTSGPTLADAGAADSI
jgi:hypothetical protein